MQVIRDWLTECDTHSLCRVSQPKTAPRRLLEIKSSDNGYELVLRDSPIEVAMGYAALSHCWGRSHIFKTLKDNIEEHKRRIEFSELPRTFQDAVVLCIKLGIPFLWIDSLCIIQDDRSDWGCESTQMAEIYENAVLVISAARASNGEAGLFSHEVEYEGLIIPTGLQDDSAPSRILHRRCLRDEPHHSWTEAYFSESVFGNWRPANPLLSRAWAFQERLLARRIIHFGKTELVWECRTELKCQCAGSKIFRERSSFKVDWDRAISDRIGHVHDLWWNLVQHYTCRQLTYHSDKLAGISGTARRLAQVFGNRLGAYYAGHWENGLLESLLWARDFRTDLRARPELKAAPTWSWASAQCGVRPCYGVEDDGNAKVLEVKCEHLDGSEFGDVISGRIVLRGKLCRVLLPNDLPLLPDNLGNEDEANDDDEKDRRTSDHHAYERARLRLMSEPLDTAIMSPKSHDGGVDTFVTAPKRHIIDCHYRVFNPDIPLTMSLSSAKLHCFIVGKNTDKDVDIGWHCHAYWSLLLKQEEARRDKVFTRIGRCIVPVEVFERDAKVETITII